VASATEGEWFEVRNASPAAIDIGGWVIDFGGGSTHTIAGSLVIPPRGLIVLGQSTNAATNDGVTVNYAYGAAFTMPDAAGAIALRNGGTTLSVSWTASGPGALGVAAVYDNASALTRTGPGTAALNCSASRTYGTAAPTLQRGTPGSPGGCLFSLSVIPVSYFDISTTGTALTFSNQDDASTSFTLTSPITLRGVSVTQLTVCTNGWILAGASTSASLSNKSLPDPYDPLGTLAAFWDDLYVLGSVRYQRIGAGVDANNPAPHWIVQWTNITHYPSSTGDNINFQIKLFDSGTVEYHYTTMTSGSTSNYANGNSATVWAEDAAGMLAIPFSINQPNITPNMALRFTP
jgi:hypothetical protein